MLRRVENCSNRRNNSLRQRNVIMCNGVMLVSYEITCSMQGLLGVFSPTTGAVQFVIVITKRATVIARNVWKTLIFINICLDFF